MLVMPFGLSNAPGAFQKATNDALKEFLGWFVHAYINDMLVFTKEPNEKKRILVHLVAKLELVFLMTREHGLYGKLSKSFFGLPDVPWLGQIFSQHGLRPDPGKISVVAEWPRPRPGNVKELQSFLGYANWFRQFM